MLQGEKIEVCNKNGIVCAENSVLCESESVFMCDRKDEFNNASSALQMLNLKVTIYI